MRSFLISLFFLSVCSVEPAAAQMVGPIFGIHGGRTIAVEAGIACDPIYDGCHAGASGGYSLTFVASDDERWVVGPQAACWLNIMLLDLGASLGYYTDFHVSSLRFRPEVGIGIPWARLVYGFDIPFTNGDFPGINHGEISLRVLIPFR